MITNTTVSNGLRLEVKPVDNYVHSEVENSKGKRMEKVRLVNRNKVGL